MNAFLSNLLSDCFSNAVPGWLGLREPDNSINGIFLCCIYGWRQVLDIILGGHMCIKIPYNTLWILFL